MRYLVYITSECKKMAERHGYTQEVDRLAKKIEVDQSVAAWDCFLPDPIIRKKLGKCRLIASQQEVTTEYGTDIVIVFCGFYTRGEADYDKTFIKTPEPFIRGLLPEKNTLCEFVLERSADEEVLELEGPSDAEYEFLYDSSTELDPSDGMILESHDWVRMIRQPRQTGLLSRYYDLINRIGVMKDIGSQSGAKILYRYYPELRAKFLIAPLVKESSNEEEQKFSGQYEEMLGPEGTTPPWDLLLKASGRSYPALVMAADEVVWQQVQQESGGNLALSPEEAEVLKNVGFASSHDVERYPLFINGRPGSGKSTILQYLFAHRLFMYLRKPANERVINPPIYLTYSQELMDVAKKSVRAIIECNVHLATECGIDLSTSENTVYMNQSFREFQPFLLGMLPSADREKFAAAKYIDFPHFRIAWDEQRKRDPGQQVRNLHPELAWHVIRTFIKGMSDSDGDYLSTEGYAELSKDHRSVSQEIFNLVFERVWEKWYKVDCEKGSWDSQDLTRFILDQNNEGKIKIEKFPGIYCDEAQDFTRNELELILNLSIFSQRRLSLDEVKQVPFAFAGDPFQTLNPTGFRWDSVKAVFHEKIVRHLVRFPGKPMMLNCQELSLNYRSSQPIVGVTNLIQILRGILFDIPDLQPQKTWFTSNVRTSERLSIANRDVTPQYFNVAEESFRKSLQDRTDLVVILPCQAGEELNFVKTDEYLSLFASEDAPTRNFLSPMQAKGLEFETVILYKFGWEMISKYPLLLKPLKTDAPHSGDSALPLEYFMNRLYVAASRAKKTLVIVDTKDGIEQLWANGDLANLDGLVARYNKKSRKERWGTEYLSLVQPGTDIGSIEVRDNPKELAELFYKTGISERNSYTLRLAAMNFRRVPDEKEAGRSEALAHEFEGDLLKAGQLYAKIQDKENALRCLWKSGSFKELAENFALFEGTIFHKAATFKMNFESNRPQFQPCNSFIHDIRKTFEMEPKLFLDPEYKDRWSSLLYEVGAAVVKAQNHSEASQTTWLLLWDDVAFLQTKGILADLKAANGELAFRAERFQEAIEIWDRLGDNRHEKYFLAKGRVLPYPDNIEWLLKANRTDEAVKLTEGQNLRALKEEDIKQIGTYYAEKQMDKEVGALLLNLRPLLFATSYLKMRGNRVTQASSKIATDIVITNWIQSQDWNTLMNSFEMGSHFTNILPYANTVLVNELAMSNTFELAPRTDRERIGRYLKKILILEPWGNIISVKAAGTAIEKANKIIDALEFYEKVWKTKQIPASSSVQQFAQTRWVKRKQILLEADRKSRNPKKHNEEIELVARKLQIDPKSLPEVPSITNEDLNVADVASITNDKPIAPKKVELNNIVRANELKSLLMDMLGKVNVDEEAKETASEWLEVLSRELLDDKPKKAIVREGLRRLVEFQSIIDFSNESIKEKKIIPSNNKRSSASINAMGRPVNPVSSLLKEFIYMVENDFGVSLEQSLTKQKSKKTMLYVDKITSGKATGSIISFYLRNRQLNSGPFSIKGKDEHYNYSYHLNGIDLDKINARFAQVYSYRGGKTQEYVRQMTEAFIELMQSGQMIEALEIAHGKKFDEYEIKWEGIS